MNISTRFQSERPGVCVYEAEPIRKDRQWLLKAPREVFNDVGAASKGKRGERRIANRRGIRSACPSANTTYARMHARPRSFARRQYARGRVHATPLVSCDLVRLSRSLQLFAWDSPGIADRGHLREEGWIGIEGVIDGQIAAVYTIEACLNARGVCRHRVREFIISSWNWLSVIDGQWVPATTSFEKSSLVEEIAGRRSRAQKRVKTRR